jgi:signal transduction histidine kinase
MPLTPDPMPSAPPDRVHPTVRMNFLVRATTYPLFGVLYGVHMWHRALPMWAFVLFVAHIFIYPHIARRIAARSEDSKTAERRNLLLDSFLIGCYVPFTGFSLWPNCAGLLGVNAGNVSFGGMRFALRAMLLSAAGTLLVGLWTGFHVDFFSASRVTESLSILVVGAYTTVFSLHSFIQGQKVAKRNAQIREQNAQIEENSRLLEERSIQLERALDEAKAANAAKSDFLATMSHELRTPLNSIIGFTNIVLRNKGGSMAPQDVVYLTRVSTSGAHLLKLINGVLDLAKVEAREMDLERVLVDLTHLVRETLNQFEPQAEARDVELLADLPGRAVIVADRERLRQIMINLVGNAVKFTEHGNVTVRVIADKGTGAPLRIDVSDSGIGIREDRLYAIFEAFHQADTTTSRQYGGTGLGLSITRSLAELMGWTIAVSSTIGVGSTFSVIFNSANAVELPAQRDAA